MIYLVLLSSRTGGKSPSWNYENDLGYSHTISDKPLKDLGIEAVSEMERLGIVVDVSYLSDEMLRPLGAFVGLNFFYPLSDREENHIADMVRHVRHMRNKGGNGILAIGTDFDGIGGKLAIADISGMEKFWDAFLDAGFSHSELEGMW